MAKKLLLGLHNSAIRDVIKRKAVRLGYEVDTVLTPEDMLAKAIAHSYDRYLMDLNLGEEGSQDISPAREVYKAIEPKTKEGSAKFLGISGGDKTVEIAKKENIPAEVSCNFKFGDFLG